MKMSDCDHLFLHGIGSSEKLDLILVFYDPFRCCNLPFLLFPCSSLQSFVFLILLTHC